MTTSFLRFRMRVLSNKGHGSSCFSSFAPVASFYLLLSTLLPSSPRHFPSPPRSHTHTHTHTRTHASLKALPSPSQRPRPVLFPTPGPATFQTGFPHPLYCCLKGTLRFPEIVFCSGSGLGFRSPRTNLQLPSKPFGLGAFQGPPQSHPCLSAHVGLETFPGVLFFLCFLFLNKPKRKRTLDAAQVFPRRKGMGMRGCSHLCRC